MRQWIKEKIGGQYLIPLLGVWNMFDEINFDSLPEKFVLKCNHGSGMNRIVNGKKNLNYKVTKEIFNQWLNTNFAYTLGLELQYRDIPRKIIAEKYIEQMDGNLFDYKIHCFHGKPTFIQCIGERNLEKHTGYQNNFSLDWTLLDWTFEDYPMFTHKISRPQKLKEMIDIAAILSSDFSYARVDLYEIEDQVFFGEMTFTPASGIYAYKRTWTPERDRELGELI